MTRRQHVMRSTAGSSAPVARGSGGDCCTMYCDSVGGGTFPHQGGEDPSVGISVCSIPVTVETSYRRIFLSATITGVRVNNLIDATCLNTYFKIYDAGPTNVDIVGTFYRQVIDLDNLDATVGFVTLTKILDFPSGTYDFRVWIDSGFITEFADQFSFETVSLQVIIGQQVAVANCPTTSPV